MTSSPYPTPYNTARHWWLLPIGLLLTACCFWSGLMYYIPFVPAMLSNRLDRVEGKAELIVPSQWVPGEVKMSPDGKRFVMDWSKEGQKQWFIWDITTGQQIPIRLDISRIRWITDDKLIVIGTVSSHRVYYVIDAQNGKGLNVLLVPERLADTIPHPETLPDIWHTAQSMYVLDTFDGAGYNVLTIHDGQAVFYRNFGRTIADERALISQVAHIDAPKYARPIPHTTNERVASPDGRWLVTREQYDSTERVAIYTRDGQLVASAWKGGWEPFFAGWASDSSGVYFQMAASGEAAHMLVSYAPLFKLSPMTPAEQRWQTITTGAWWAGGMALAGGATWWLVRRRRRRAAGG